jgi:hypothetical protein
MNASPRKLRGKPVTVVYREISLPTKERTEKADYQGHHEGGDSRAGTRVIRLRDTIDRLFDRESLTGTEYAALQKYKHHWVSAGLEGSPGSVDLNRVFSADPGSMSGMAKSEAQAHHRQQFRKGKEAIGGRQSIVVDRVVLEDWTLDSAGCCLGWRSKPQAIAAATEMLRDAGYGCLGCGGSDD